jgi:chitin disaccharide deacetylase
VTPLILNADDFLLSDGICKGIWALLEKGAVSTTTVMTIVPSAVGRARNWRLSELLGVAGVHLQLSSGRPLSSHRDAPTLVDVSGDFVPRESLAEVAPPDVEQEWRRQIELAYELLGGPPSHLDSHHGVHHLPNCIDVYVRLAHEYQLPVRGGEGEVRERVPSPHIRGSTVVVYDWTAKGLGVSDLHGMLLAAAQEAGSGGSVEVVTHPGFSDAYLQSTSSLNDLRDQDLAALDELAETGWLVRNGFALTTFRELAEHRSGSDL